ncbi:glycine cleavage system protein GcvH [Candidatus Latescibacterota bacterium]
MDEDSHVPMDLSFIDEHTWVLVENDIGTIGLSDYAQSELSEIVYIDLPEVGFEVSQGSPFGTVEAMKTVAELIAPMSGEVIEKNENLDSDPRLVNMDPYGEGWMIKIKLHEPEEIENIFNPQEYILYVSGEDI